METINISKTRHRSPVTMVKSWSQEKKCQNYFRVTTSLCITYGARKCREEIDTDSSRGKNDGFWLLWGIFLTSIQNKILLWQCWRKESLIQLTFAHKWKINKVKEDRGEKLFQTFIFSKLPSAHEVLKRRNVVNIEFFLKQRA